MSRVLLDDLEADLAANTPDEYSEMLYDEPILPPPASHGQYLCSHGPQPCSHGYSHVAMVTALSSEM